MQFSPLGFSVFPFFDGSGSLPHKILPISLGTATVNSLLDSQELFVGCCPRADGIWQPLTQAQGHS